MNYFQFAIASIVDANTGYGLSHNIDKIDYAAAASHGRSIRSRSIVALFGKIRGRLSKAIATIRDRQAQKLKIRQLARLNDHILEDIGITRGDVVALQTGQIDIQQLEAQRQKRRSTTHLHQAAATRNIGDKVQRNALNEAVYAKAKCA